MVFNRRDLTKAFSPNKVKKFSKRRSSGPGGVKPSTSGSTMRSDSAQTSIKVIVRVRPHNEKELQDNYRTVIKILDNQMLIFDPKEEENPFFYRGVVQKGRDLLKKQNKELQFVFDRIFDLSSSNIDVYEGSTKELIASLLEGYNCSVFAYGATGAGKTHTMLGKEGDPGITYRTMAELFAQIELQRDSRDFNLGVSYLEIYNENVQDLLHKVGPLHLREDRAGVIVAGLKIITIHNADELLCLLAKGNKNRTQHATDANQESSRSHAVFQVYVNITSKVDGQVKHVKLSMIDLAGSERASATGCTGARFKEGANINKSLLALGNCINNLADGIKHIPYRDSKLTRLLKDSLGGNCQTVMIANISPSSASFEDTYNTLRYANRAKKIKTSVKKNIVSCQMHISSYIKMVEEQKKELETLKQKLLAYESGSLPISVAPQSSQNNEKTEERTQEIMEMSNKLIELYNKKRILNEKILSLESSDKILYCRILYKKAADNRLHNLTAAVETTIQDEKNASGKSRVNKSLQYFKRQREGIKIQLKSIWGDLCKVEENLAEVLLEIKSKDLHDKLEDKISFLTAEVETLRMQQQFEHVKKISSLQQCEMQSVSSMVKMMSSTLQNYYNMMRGGGTITEKMKQEFKQLVKSLEGIRNIKWSDMNMTKQEEDFYSTTCLSIQELEHPSTNTMPDLLELNSDDEEAQTPSPTNLLSSTTFDCTPPKNIIPTTEVLLNSTITLSSDTAPITDDGCSAVESNPLNSTFCLPEPKGRKRVLSDSKNQVHSRSPAKQPKKISPKNRFEVNGPVQNGKENSKEFPKPTMTAKSIAILNKLKADRMKPPLLTPVLHGDNSDSSLKAVRGKERRGLTSTHPYQKPSINKPQSKGTPALPSSRVPW